MSADLPPEVTACSNCGGTKDVAVCSFDMDLPTIVLCQICRFTIVSDRELFESMRKR